MNENTARQLCENAGMHWHEADDADRLAALLATHIAEALQSDLNALGVASLVVSGGSTPAPVFKRLSTLDINWSKVSVTLADERWVPPGHEDSNESLVKETLLVDNAAAASFVSLYRHDMTSAQAIDTVASDVRAMAQPFSVTVLGMGGDGHTASLFPDAPAEELQAAMALDNTATACVLNPPSVSQARITLTRAALLNSRQRFLHITGDNKRDVLGKALLDCATVSGSALQAYSAGMKPIVGLLGVESQAASVFWSP